MTLEDLQAMHQEQQKVVEQAAADLNGKLGGLIMLNTLIETEKKRLDPVSQS